MLEQVEQVHIGLSIGDQGLSATDQPHFLDVAFSHIGVLQLERVSALLLCYGVQLHHRTLSSDQDERLSRGGGWPVVASVEF